MVVVKAISMYLRVQISSVEVDMIDALALDSRMQHVLRRRSEVAAVQISERS